MGALAKYEGNKGNGPWLQMKCVLGHIALPEKSKISKAPIAM
jgi:hypothetical protein